MDYNKADLTLLKKKGITDSDIERQLSNFQKLGFPFWNSTTESVL